MAHPLRWSLLPLALLLLAWHLAVEAKVYPPVLLAPPAKVFAVFIDDWQTLLDNAAASLRADPALNMLSASPNDSDGFCCCRKCRWRTS